ncbi:MAG: ferredoxin [Candidatus Aquicultor sp.]|nr:ferredoxin [Candidatus Aquicultor sp.]
MKKPVIDHDECIGDGICSDLCPEVFELRDDGLAYVINEKPDESLHGKVDEAIEECPTGAIAWAEE